MAYSLHTVVHLLLGVETLNKNRSEKEHGSQHLHSFNKMGIGTGLEASIRISVKNGFGVTYWKKWTFHPIDCLIAITQAKVFQTDQCLDRFQLQRLPLRLFIHMP